MTKTQETFLFYFLHRILLNAGCSCHGHARRRGKDCCYFSPLLFFALKVSRLLIASFVLWLASQCVLWLENLFSLFASGNHGSICAMGAPDPKGNEKRLSVWLLHLWPNTHPWIDEVIVNSGQEYSLCARSARSGANLPLLAVYSNGGLGQFLNKLKPLHLVPQMNVR